MILKKIVSGGQTGADRAGLDAAIEVGIPVGGYCPKGRLAEDGTVPDCYPLTELVKGGYASRTEKNVVESDGTLILNMGKLSGGTRLTVECARKHGKPFLIVQMDDNPTSDSVIRWITDNSIHVLNVAGPRESKCPGLHDSAEVFLKQVFIRMRDIEAAYSLDEETLLTLPDTPPKEWMGTWTHQEPYK